MVIAPCGIRIETLVERLAKVTAMNKARHAAKVANKKLPRDKALSYDRFDAAVLLSLQLLHQVEQIAPEALERAAKAHHDAATHAATAHDH